MFNKHMRTCSFFLFDLGLCEFFLQPPEGLVPVLVLLLSVAQVFPEDVDVLAPWYLSLSSQCS